MDYLLRDSHHAGVAYGRFDHFRLIDTLRILPTLTPADGQPPAEPALGVEEGGLHSAEALLLARYFMYSQVYFHPIRRIYDIHLKDFLKAWLPGGKFPTDLETHLRRTDNEVSSAIWEAAHDPTNPGHADARRIVGHQHFKPFYRRRPEDVAKNPEAGQVVFEAAEQEFGRDNVRHDRYTQKGSATVFPVLTDEGRIASSVELSETLQRLPLVDVDYVFVHADQLETAEHWLNANRERLIQPTGEKA
jgi:HD superfamily phosphohydrolase